MSNALLNLKRNRVLVFQSILFVATYIIAYVFSKLDFDIHHNGIMLNGALGVLSSKGKFYTGFYYHYGPLTAMIHALSLIVFGIKLMSMNIITSFFMH